MSFGIYKFPKDASYVTLRNQNRMIYANYRIQQNNVDQGCQLRVALENGGVADADIIPKLLEGARATTAPEIQIDISSAACPIAPTPVVDPYSSDKIYQSLTTSAAAYTAATAGSWVAVTSAEYSALQTNVASTNIAGLATSILTSISGWGFTSQDFFAALSVDTNSFKIPANNYVYAFAIRIKTSPTTTLDNFNVYGNANTAGTSGFTKIGSTLPALAAGINYFVLKSQTAVNAATDGLLGITAPGNATLTLSQSYHIVYSSSATGTSFSYTNSVTLPITSSTTLLSPAGASWTLAIQALATPTKQWV